ncbi:uncharacterized protein [Cicer arietinum]|uniref:Uncharacterized protein LOC101493058 isoform X2 n=1 Tax=Cicer arietinum TaxID=3827 RepID=A0A3Q7YCJ7_CICAR|nr:uncharacterized protein LOC101493058 isoform X2 [Cicer arietinum]
MTTLMFDDRDNILQNISAGEVNDFLGEYTLEGKWENVIMLYYEFPKEAHTTTLIDQSDNTALHIAIDLNEEFVVKELLNAILTHHVHNIDDVSDNQRVKALEMINMSGDTPLHFAASRGFARICKWIIGRNNERIYLLSRKNNYGETPLFQAAVNWRKQAFAYLSHISKERVTLLDLVRNDGDSILHAAIRGEYFDLAVIIVHYYDFLSTHFNREESTPLKVLATRPSAFKSASNLSWYKRLVYHCIIVEQLDAERTMRYYLRKMEVDQNSNKMKFPANYTALCGFVSIWLSATGIGTGTGTKISKKKKQFDAENPSNDNRPLLKSEKHQVGFLPPNYETLQRFVKSTYVHTLGLSGVELKDVKIAKKKHEWSSQLLKALMKRPYEAFTGSGGRPTDIEIDPEMYNIFPQWKRDGNTSRMECFRKPETESENEIVKYRQPVIVENLRMIMHSKPEVWNNLILVADDDENTILHLAADGTDKPWQIAGSALQMMWDIKWFQYVKSLVPQHFYFRSNKNGKTSGEIFKTTHEGLIKESSDWLKETSESCSVVAALVAGVSFATASAVPGGTTDEGRPILEGKPAFDIFAISSLVGLCFSVTGLIMFLSILTSRKQAKDFRRDLPLKLLLGLSSLFVSIASMFVSFCTGHFFLLNHKYKSVMFPIYGATCLPVTFYAVAQFPLYFDLLTAILTKVPMATDKGDKL